MEYLVFLSFKNYYQAEPTIRKIYIDVVGKPLSKFPGQKNPFALYKLQNESPKISQKYFFHYENPV